MGQKRSPCRRWNGVAAVFLEILPELSCFSAMRLMQNIVPGKLSPDLTGHIHRVRRYSAAGAYLLAFWKTAWFLLSRLFILIVGMDAFLFKFRACAKHAIGTSSFSDFWVCFVFLNQMLGVVHLKRFTLDRIAIFVFGGEDGIVDSKERSIILAWWAKLMQQIWWRHGPFHGLCIYITFSDMDMQSLLLSEDHSKKDSQFKNRV